MDLEKAIQILKDYIGEEKTNLTFNEWQTQIFIAIDKSLETLGELKEQNEVLSDTVNMLSPLMMENKRLKEEIMN